MAVHLILKVGHTLRQLRQRRFVTLGQFLHSLRERLVDAIHLAVNVGVEAGEPLVVDDQRFEFVLGQLGILGVGGVIVIDCVFERSPWFAT